MIKKFKKKSYRWSALGILAVAAVASVSLLNANADGSSEKQIKANTDGKAKIETKTETTVYTPPKHKENYDEMTEEEILTKMINTVDYLKPQEVNIKFITILVLVMRSLNMILV
ncbi:hypothetical protein [Lysinibacillus pakistanensis]|uniref:hypothetical protein n=1 Tax=Lysinibacillus pakistanensis TaxID=759811 RepID=UPI003D2C15E8